MNDDGKGVLTMLFAQTVGGMRIETQVERFSTTPRGSPSRHLSLWKVDG